MKHWLIPMQREQRDTLLLLLAVLTVLLPHAAHLPLWISLTITLTLGWRALLTVRGWRLPPIWLLLPLAVAAMAGVRTEFHTWLGRDSGVAMLTLLLGFKMLEMRARRDVMVVVFLCSFVLLSNYFYNQSMLMALYTLFAVIVLLTAQLSFQYTDRQPPLWQRVRSMLRLLWLGTPLALLLFLAFPRINGPLWGLPGDAQNGRTGLSDSMAPGSIAALARSDALAFRVRFLTAHPSPAQLYWRSIVLGNYDGRTWTRAPARRVDLDLHTDGTPLSYEVTLEVQHNRYLPALELSATPLAMAGYPLRDTDEQEVLSAAVPTDRLRYSATAWLAYRLQPQATRSTLQRWLALPAGHNPHTLALAARLAGDHAPASVLAERLLGFLRDGDYIYTLEPPLLGRNAVDEFLFGSKAGFCEHYAGAFVYALRAMGVPARVVTGYQGGEFNPVDGLLSVRQSDAHAWAEYWQAGTGWQRVDPTAAVAPQRVTGGSKPARDSAQSTLLQTLRAQAASVFDTLRFQHAAWQARWNQWVLDYSPERQQALLDFSTSTPGHLGRLGAGALGVAVLLCGLVWLRRQRQRDPLLLMYAQFCRRQARRGYARLPDEGPQAYAARLRTMPASAAQQAAIQEFLMLYSRLRYAADSTESRTASLWTLRKLLVLCR